jgi:hypothetical protein
MPPTQSIDFAISETTESIFGYSSRFCDNESFEISFDTQPVFEESSASNFVSIVEMEPLSIRESAVQLFDAATDSLYDEMTQ